MTGLAARRGLWAFAAGLVAATGQAPLGLWPLALAGFAGLFLILRPAATPRQAARWAWFFGGGYFALALSWIVEPFLVDMARHGWMAPFALLLLSFGLALFWAAAGYAAGWIGQGARRSLALVVALTAAELVRTYVFTGFPWAAIGHLWIGVPPIQLASLGGAQALTVLTLLLVALPVAWPRAGGLAALTLMVGAWAYGAQRLAQPAPTSAEAAIIRLIQPNAPQHLKWRQDMVPVFFERQLAYTAAPADPAPDLIIWPETAVPVMLEQPGSVLERMAAAASGVPVVAGIQRRDAQGSYNSLAVIGADGQTLEVYDKHHLVPFGEYMPFQALFARLGIAGLAANDVFGYAPGPGPQVLDLGGTGPALPLICYEAVFPQDLRGTPRPRWLLHITNDAWFGTLSGPYQHLAQAQLRAVEQGLPLLRSANTGVSAVIDGRGQVRARLPLNQAGFLTEALPPALPPTLYARTGDWPWLPLLIVAGMTLFTTRRAKGN